MGKYRRTRGAKHENVDHGAAFDVGKYGSAVANETDFVSHCGHVGEQKTRKTYVSKVLGWEDVRWDSGERARTGVCQGPV